MSQTTIDPTVQIAERLDAVAADSSLDLLNLAAHLTQASAELRALDKVRKAASEAMHMTLSSEASYEQLQQAFHDLRLELIGWELRHRPKALDHDG